MDNVQQPVSVGIGERDCFIFTKTCTPSIVLYTISYWVWIIRFKDKPKSESVSMGVGIELDISAKYPYTHIQTI